MNLLPSWQQLSLAMALLLAATAPYTATAQSSAITPDNHGSVTIDASRLHTVLPLTAPWRFSPDNNPAFTHPTFDDSAWPSLTPKPDQRFSAAHEPDLTAGQCWARLHLHLLNATDPLAITLSARDGAQYVVFANGREIGRSKGFSSQTKYFDIPFRLQLPASDDIVLAVHFVQPAYSLLRYFPLEGVEIGQTQAVADRVGLAHYADFEANWLSYIALAVISLACVPFSLALLLAQRDHIEYFWFALFCLFSGGCYGILSAIFLTHLPYSPWLDDLTALFGTLQMLVGLEFAAALSETRPTLLLRLIEAVMLITPILYGFGAFQMLTLITAITTILWLAMVVYLLGPAYRRGSKECGLLLIAFVLLQSSALLAQAQSSFPSRFGEPWQGHFGGIGLRIVDVGELLIILAVLAIVLYRFIRVSKTEQLASSELEAARTVQQLLIPAVQPATPGFAIESIYLPARQVGGDFFLILPAAGPAGNSILVIMGDVSGKGLQAAMVVSTIIGGLRMQLSSQPAEVLAHLNRMLAGHVTGFATCCAALLHPDGRMQIANAGNPAPYCNGVELDTLPGLPLGLVPDVAYEETLATLPSQARLTFVSDGVIEATATHTNELFGFDRTLAISREPAATIADAAVQFGTGAPQADDITVLTITRTGNPPPQTTS